MGTLDFYRNVHNRHHRIHDTAANYTLHEVSFIIIILQRLKSPLYLPHSLNTQSESSVSIY